MDNMVERLKVIEDYDALCDKLYSALCINDCVDERELENRMNLLKNKIFPIIDEFKKQVYSNMRQLLLFYERPLRQMQRCLFFK